MKTEPAKGGRLRQEALGYLGFKPVSVEGPSNADVARQ
jgi:hypothetical protein